MNSNFNTNISKKDLLIEEMRETFGEKELNEYLEDNEILMYNDDFCAANIDIKNINDLYKKEMRVAYIRELKEEYQEYLEEIQTILDEDE